MPERTRPIIITPNLNNKVFTAGKGYAVLPSRDNPQNPRIGEVVDDIGCRRVVSLPVGKPCPHLRPVNLPRPSNTLEQWDQDQIMGHWILTKDN